MAYSTLHSRLKGAIKDHLHTDLSIKNPHALPALEKVVISTGMNKSKMDSKETHAYVQEVLAQITGQKPVVTKARKAISNFKTREGMIVGAMVTLRGESMESFLDRLISYVFPRIRDFRGLNTKLDGQGNYSIGLNDHSIFPEVPLPDPRQIFGLQIQIKTTATNDKDAMMLLRRMGFPFKTKEGQQTDVNSLSTPDSN